MAEYLITCISKIPRENLHESITHLGGFRVDGNRSLLTGEQWRFSRLEVIELIQAGSNIFYTQVNRKRADVKIVTGSNGYYLRTHVDGIENDNLLALPECIL